MITCPRCQGKGEIEVGTGELIRMAREKAGLTQTQLAAAIGSQPARMSMLEHGREEPTLPKLRKIAEVCNCSVKDLVA